MTTNWKEQLKYVATQDGDTDWKEQLKFAAAQEGVDYAAVAKAFMDQAYGFVASKAKILFSDPHRLGFEVVRRNEKATRMVGIFSFRVSESLLYAPVFFVNGEVRPVDMLYRADVKRFVPLTEEWCAFLVEGVNQEAGSLIDKGRRRQPDGHIDRLSYPMLRKYAAEDNVDAAWDEMCKVAAAAYADEVPLLLEKLAAEFGAPIVEKIASLEATPAVLRMLSEHYDLEKLAACDIEKSASEEVCGTLTLVNDHLVAKDAAESDRVVFDGYCLRDTRPAESKAVVVDYSTDFNTIATPGVYNALLQDGTTKQVLALRIGYHGFDNECRSSPPRSCYGGSCDSDQELALLDGGKMTTFYVRDSKFYGTLLPNADVDELLTFESVQTGRHYNRVDISSMTSLGLCRVIEKDSKGLVIALPWEDKSIPIFFSDRQPEAVSGRTFGSSLRFYEVTPETSSHESLAADRCAGRSERVDLPLMSHAGMEQWIRTAGGQANSEIIELESRRDGMFDVKFDNKIAGRDLTSKEAHILLATRGNMDADEALDVVRNPRKVIAYARIKNAYTTRVDPERNWEEHTDPVFGNTVTYPQEQILATTTPQRFFDEAREGDRYEATPRSSLQHALPEEMIMHAPPEQLAQMAQAMQLPHIFDHGVVGQLSGSVFDAVAQVGEYISDIEQGMDRIFRVLFLIRYRPAEFEDAFGTDTLMETEQEFSELGRMMGEVLLKMIRRHKSTKI